MPINKEPISNKNASHVEKKEKQLYKKENDMIEFSLIEPLYEFSDMVIDDKLKSDIIDAMSIFMFKEKIFDEWKLSRVIKKPTNICINFYGEPGTGKTMAANAVAKELGLKILKINYADIESKYVGETSKNLVKMFEKAQEKNALILFDEADALLSKRVTNMSNATDVSVNQTRSVLLTLLDGFKGMVIFTTNFISNYDSAFMRRIPYHIKFDLPNENERINLLKHYLINTVPNDILVVDIAKRYPGITGADIANATLVAALKTARNYKSIMQQIDFEDALDSILRSKVENKGEIIEVESREVTEQYALEQINKRRG